MITEISEIIGMEIYTEGAVFLGTVDNVVLDLEKSCIYGLYVRRTNPTIVEESRAVVIPFRWVREVADIVLLSYFPRLVKLEDVKDKVRKVRKVKEARHHVIPDAIPEALERMEHSIEHGIDALKTRMPRPHLPHLSPPKKKKYY